MSYLLWTILGTLIIYIFIIIGAIIFFHLKYKHNVRIKEVVHGRKIVRDHKAREYQKDGVYYWRISQESDKDRRLLPIPPSEAIELDYKGKKCVECYRHPTGEVTYIKDNNNVAEPPEFELDAKLRDKLTKNKSPHEAEIAISEWRKLKKQEWQDENNVIEAYQPLTTNQRSTIVTRVQNAEKRKGKSWKDNIVVLVGVGMILMFVVCLMIFWGDVTKPFIDGMKEQKAVKQLDLEKLQILKEIQSGIQTIDDEQDQLNKRVDKLEKNKGEIPN